MRLSRLHIVRIVQSIGLMVLILFHGCKSKTNIIYPPTDITLTVKDENGNLLKGAVVALFDDQDKYLQAKQLSLTQFAVKTVVSNSQGVAEFDGIDYTSNYWVYAVYKSGGNAYNNNNSTYQLDVKLAQGSHTYATITLKSSDSYVGFWTQGTQNVLPITIYISSAYSDSLLTGDTVTLNQSVSSAPATFASQGTASRQKNPGEYSWSAHNEKGCLWTGQFTLKDGSFVPVQMPACALGTVSFYASKLSASAYPISISLNGNDYIGSIKGIRLIAPSSCTDTNKTVIAQRDYNPSYTYVATPADKSCEWIGAFSIISDTCIVIHLQDYDCN